MSVREMVAGDPRARLAGMPDEALRLLEEIVDLDRELSAAAKVRLRTYLVEEWRRRLTDG